MNEGLIERRIEVGPWNIYFLDSGRQPSERLPLVLVHGVIASHRYMLPTAAILAQRYRVLVPDMPGYGQSAGSPAVTVPELADAIIRWLHALTIEQAIVFGNSFGCQVAVEVALRCPELVQGLVLLGPVVDPHAHSLPRQGLRLAIDLTRERYSLIGVLLRDLLDMGLPKALEELAVMMDYSTAEALPALLMPTLVLRGSRDPIAPLDWVQTAAELAPCGEYAEISGGPHAANYSCPYGVAWEIDRFIDRQLS